LEMPICNAWVRQAQGGGDAKDSALRVKIEGQ
jgi:hypothetical protein